jgi:hypothetical protein
MDMDAREGIDRHGGVTVVEQVLMTVAIGLIVALLLMVLAAM